MRSLPTMLATGAIVLFAAGCGGSSNDSSSTTAARGYDDTVAAVNDVCNRANAELNPLGKGITGNAKKDATLVAKLVDGNKKYLDQLKAIKPDPKLKAAFDTYVSAVEQGQTKAEAASAAAQGGDDQAYQAALKDLSATDKVTHPAARALGATDCAKN